jgi:hypothetical protein
MKLHCDPNDLTDVELDDSEDIMDLDNTEVLNFLDINHEMLPREEGEGFASWLNDRLDAVEEESIEEILEAMDNFDLLEEGIEE